MARRKKQQDDGPAGLPPWMATYSDLVTLLLTFFVLMMAMANFSDLRKIDAVVTSIRLSFGADGNDRRLLQVAEEEAFTRDSDQTDTIKPSVARLRDAFSEHISDAYIDMSETETEVRIRLDGRVFFRRGSAELHPMAYAILADVGKVLAKERVYVRVEGFADTVGNELNNWELSSDRSVAVVMALREKGPIDGERLEAVGLGAARASEQAVRDPSWARRVELVLRSDDVSGAAAASAASDGVE